MDATSYRWDDVQEDNPIDLLTRRMVKGERMMVARVRLAKGCHVALHHHESEQIAIILSGRVLWTLGAEGSPERRQEEMQGGQVLILPSNVPHSVDVLEDAEIMDVLTPIGLMGVDRQNG